MADFTYARSPTLGGQWSGQYYFLVDQTEAYAQQIDDANTASGESTLANTLSTLANTFSLYPTTSAMQQYVQGVAFAGVSPSEIGENGEVIAINSLGTGFEGVTNELLYQRIETAVKKAILIFGD